MRKNLLLVAALFSCSLFTNAQIWVEQNTNFPAGSTGVDHISTPAPGVAWILGYDGSGGGANFIDFSRTTDGGATWIPGTVGSDTTTYAFSNISAIDSMNAWVAMFDNVAGTGGGIWNTTDGGASWNQQGTGLIFDANSFPDVVHFWDADTGFAMGDPNNGYFEIYTTVDGGASWSRTDQADIPAPLTSEFGIVDYYDVYGSTIWFATDKGRVYKSTDKGYHWTVASVLTLPSTQAMKVKFLDDNNGLARIINATTGAFVSMRKTTDGGATWATQAISGTFFTSDFGRVPGSSTYISTGAATGWSGSSYSLDLGLTWVTIDTSIQHTSFGAYDINNVWSGNFGDALNGGGIFKLDPGLLSVQSPLSLQADITAYPNPSSGIINMNFKAGRNVNLKVSVTNTIGEQVYSEQFSNVTMFVHSFNFSGLAKGVYMLNLEYGSERSTQKLIIQ